MRGNPEFFAGGILVHNCDASLYAYRRAWHFLHRDEPAKVHNGTPAWFAEEVKKMEELALQKALRATQPVWMYGEESQDDDSEDM